MILTKFRANSTNTGFFPTVLMVYELEFICSSFHFMEGLYETLLSHWMLNNCFFGLLLKLKSQKFVPSKHPASSKLKKMRRDVQKNQKTTGWPQTQLGLKILWAVLQWIDLFQAHLMHCPFARTENPSSNRWRTQKSGAALLLNSQTATTTLNRCGIELQLLFPGSLLNIHLLMSFHFKVQLMRCLSTRGSKSCCSACRWINMERENAKFLIQLLSWEPLCICPHFLISLHENFQSCYSNICCASIYYFFFQKE